MFKGKRKNLPFIIFGILSFNLFCSLNSLAKDESNKNVLKSRKFKFNELSIQNDNLLKRDFIKYHNNIKKALGDKGEIKKSGKLVDIESDIQYQENNVIYAEGNAILTFDDIEIRGDNVIYNTENKDFMVEGNVRFYKGSQYFEAKKLFYNLKVGEGYIDDIYGVIDADDFNENFNIQDVSSRRYKKNIENLKYLNKISLGLESNKSLIKKYRVSNFKVDLPSIKTWRFKSNRMNLKLGILSSDEIYFSNDPFNEPQLLLQSKNFTGEIINNKLKIISRNSWIILDNKIKLPLGKRTYYDDDVISKWSIGFDQKDKDGFFLKRSFKEIKFNDNFNLKLEPYFLFHRAIKDYSKAFVKKGDSLLSSKSTLDIKTSDVFALDTYLNGTIKNWDLNLKSTFNSFNTERLEQLNRSKLVLSKTFLLNDNSPYFSNSENVKNQNLIYKNIFNINFYSSYREKVARAFSGSQEIYFGNGVILTNKKSWNKKDSNISIDFKYDFGSFTAEKFNEKKFDTLFRNAFRSNITSQFPLLTKDNKDLFINKDYKYYPKLVNKGIFWTFNLNSGIYQYSDNSNQKGISISSGPLLIFGDLKNNFFDYTKIDIRSNYIFKDGQSPFKFDDIDNSAKLSFNLEQQIYGPLIFGYNSSLNLDSNSSKYGHFSKAKYFLDFRRRAYSLGAFYNSSSKTAGFMFNIFNFNYSGISPTF